MTDFIVPVYTSYYGNRDIYLDSFTPINIARKQPNWLTDEFPTYYRAVPSWATLTEWNKSKKTEEDMVAYIKRYYCTTLNIYGKDSPFVHLDNLIALTSEMKTMRGERPVVLTCYEGIGKFCHRLIYAIYLKLTIGISIPELGYDPVENPIQTLIADTLRLLIEGKELK